MVQAASGILEIVIFLFIGILFKRFGILTEKEMAGIKKVILYLAIPSVLFLSFSSLEFSIAFIPVIGAVFSINFILFWLGVLLFKLGGSKNRILPLCLSTMNFALVGLPLYEAVFGFDKLNHYTMLDVGNEIFIWFVFHFMFRWFLSNGKAEKGVGSGFIRSPILWGIMLGCVFSLLNINITTNGNVVIQGISHGISGLAKLTTPLILLFVGYNISLSPKYLKRSLKLTLLRLFLAYGIGYGIKILVLDRFVESTVYYNSAFFLLISLPAIFSVPIFAADYLDEDEMFTLNNTIVLHSIFTIVLFAIYTFFTGV
ncbi:MAG: AEC family transporter [Spirochaetales bacterium]|nr:AEC family transporter [Spirochaetales bacterium]